jgi:urease beta subunit
MTRFATDRPYADPERAARKLLEIANTTEAIQDGRIHIEKINGPFLFTHSGSPAEYGAGLQLAIARGWLWKHESGTYVRFTPGRRRVVRLMATKGWSRRFADPMPDGRHEGVTTGGG